MTGIIVNDQVPEWLPIYYIQPLELVAMALAMGEKKWQKCEEEAQRRNISKHSKAVAYGADVRLTLRKEHDMRPPPEWLEEAKINQDTLAKARIVLED